MSPYRKYCRRKRREASWRRRMALWGLAFLLAWMSAVFLTLSQVNGQSLVVFTGPNCPACRTIEPIVDQLKSEGTPIVEYNAASSPSKCLEFGVDRIPTTIAFDANGREVGRIVGATSRDRIIAMLPRQRSAPTTSIASSSCRISATVAGNSMEKWNGTGVLIGKDQQSGSVLTCSHIFRDSRPPYVVTFPSGARYQANLLANDESVELALLAIQPPAEQPLPISFSPSGILIAGGFGEDGRWRVVSGPFAGNSAHWYVMNGGNTRMGDSGGPVVNQTGELVGIAWGCRDQQVRFCGGEYMRQFLTRTPTYQQPRVAVQQQAPQPQLPSTYQQAQPGPLPAAAADNGTPLQECADRLVAIDAELKRLDEAKQDKAAAAKYQEETIAAGAKPIQDADKAKVEGERERVSIYQEIAAAKKDAIDKAKEDAADLVAHVRSVAVAAAHSKAESVRNELLSKLPAAGGAAIRFTLRNVLLGLGVGSGGVGIAAWVGGRIAARGLRKLIEKKTGNESADEGRARILKFPFWRARSASQSAAKNSEGAASPAGSFPGTSKAGGDGATSDLRLYQPIERDLSEGEQLLQLEGREGRDPLQDAIAQGITRRRLQAFADSDRDPDKAKWAKELLVECDQRFNEIAPTLYEPAKS